MTEKWIELQCIKCAERIRVLAHRTIGPPGLTCPFHESGMTYYMQRVPQEGAAQSADHGCGPAPYGRPTCPVCDLPMRDVAECEGCGWVRPNTLGAHFELADIPPATGPDDIDPILQGGMLGDPKGYTYCMACRELGRNCTMLQQDGNWVCHGCGATVPVRS
jgi:hypothetical protein